MFMWSCKGSALSANQIFDIHSVSPSTGSMMSSSFCRVASNCFHFGNGSRLGGCILGFTDLLTLSCTCQYRCLPIIWKLWSVCVLLFVLPCCHFRVCYEFQWLAVQPGRVVSSILPSRNMKDELCCGLWQWIWSLLVFVPYLTPVWAPG